MLRRVASDAHHEMRLAHAGVLFIRLESGAFAHCRHQAAGYPQVKFLANRPCGQLFPRRRESRLDAPFGAHTVSAVLARVQWLSRVATDRDIEPRR